MNRLEEIKQEKLEIRKSLDAADCNLAEVEKKLQQLEAEEMEIRKKADIISRLDSGDIQGNTIESRKEDNPRMENTNKFNSLEYRKAFAAYITGGAALPAEYRSEQNRTNAAAVIPNTIVNRIVEKLEGYGGIYGNVSHTSYNTGVSIPVASVLPIAEWTGESKGTENKTSTYSQITFNGHKLRVAVACSLELAIQSIEAFETHLVNSITNAMIKALDVAIISGGGASKGQPDGILNAATDNEVVLDKMTFAKVCEMEAAIPSAYDADTVYLMNKATLFAIRSMKDASNNLVNTEAVEGQPCYTLMGRRVIVTPTLPAIDKAASGEVVAIAVRLSDYVMNFNYNMTIAKRENWDNENQEVKAVAVADGHLVDNGSLVFYSKPAA